MEDLVEALIAESAPETLNKPLRLFNKIASNICSAPSEPKFRRLKRDTIAAKMEKAPGVFALLEAIGFEVDGEFLVLPEECCLEAMQTASTAINRYLNTTSTEQEAKTAEKMEAEKRLREVQEKNRQLVAAEKARKQAYRDEQKRKVDRNKDELKHRVIKDSVAETRAFGATQVKVEFKTSGGG